MARLSCTFVASSNPLRNCTFSILLTLTSALRRSAQPALNILQVLHRAAPSTNLRRQKKQAASPHGRNSTAAKKETSECSTPNGVHECNHTCINQWFCFCQGCCCSSCPGYPRSTRIQALARASQPASNTMLIDGSSLGHNKTAYQSFCLFSSPLLVVELLHPTLSTPSDRPMSPGIVNLPRVHSMRDIFERARAM